MSRYVPSWDLEDINPNHDVFKLDYEVAELKWQNGQLAMQELGNRRVPTKSQPTTSWDNPPATDTLETIVNQATHKPCYKPQGMVVNDNELVPSLNSHKPTVTAGNLSASATMTADALVPSSNNRIIDAGCSTHVASCSGTFGIGDTYDGDHLDGQRLTTNSMGSPENTSSGRDCSMSTFLDDFVCHCSTQREVNVIKEKKGKAKSSVLNKRTAASHNQSERKRRDKINQRMTTLQKLVPNSSKTDKASMLDEVIEYVKQLQAQVHMANSMNMSPLMIPLVMQQQQQQQQQQQMQQMSMMNSMGMGMGLGLSNIPYPSIFRPTPSWNSPPADPMSAFLASQTQPVNMDSYNRMGALYQHYAKSSLWPTSKN